MTAKCFIDGTFFTSVFSLCGKLNFIQWFVFFESIKTQFYFRRMTFHYYVWAMPKYIDLAMDLDTFIILCS